jgi:excisionase family DNA binding protein
MPIQIEEMTFYTVGEVAERFRVTPQTIRTYIKEGKLRASRIGRPLLITSRALEEFTSENLRDEEPRPVKAA